jgi:hypothetical protein
MDTKSLHRPKNQGLTASSRLNFRLQRTAQSLLFSRGAEKQHRTCLCCRTVTSDSVGIHRRADGNGARLSGLRYCGSVWSCPICAAKVTEARRSELMEGLARAKSLGFRPWLLTLTFPHGRGQPLLELLDSFQAALTKFKNSKGYKAIMADLERLGSIRSLEVTWGEANGWHPHTHDLVFTKGDLSGALDELKNLWFAALTKEKLVTESDRVDFNLFGLDIRDGTYAAEYVAKFGREAEKEGWGLSGELTKAHAKIGIRNERFTPFQLLQWASLQATSHAEKRERAQARALFKEFSEAFAGKRMLSYSPKLKQAIAAGTLEDEAIAAMETKLPDEQNCGRITIDDYSEVTRRGAITELLDFAARYLTDSETAQDDLDDWLTWLKTTPETMGGQLWQRRQFGGKGELEIYANA